MPADPLSKLTRGMLHPLAILLFTGLLVAALWSVLLIEQERNYRDVERYAKENAFSVARAFEEHVARSFDNIDAALRVLREAWINDHDAFSDKVHIMQAAYDEALLVQIAVIGADGRLAYSNLDPDAKPVDLRDREHFQVHRDREVDELFISEPVKGRVSGRYSIQMTRPVLMEDGRFGGVLVISLSPSYYSSFFGSIDLGEDDSIFLAGTDRVMRARGINAQLDVESIGSTLPADRPFLRPDSPRAGAYEAIGFVDGVRRLIAFRHVEGYPMVVGVTSKVDTIFSQHEQLWSGYKKGAAVVSLLLVVGAGWLARSLQLQRQFKKRLVYVNDSLRILNDIATQSKEGIATKMKKALELGCRHLGVECGIVSRISGNQYLVESCYAPPKSELKNGDIFDLSHSYCSITLDRNDVVAIHYMSHSEYAGHPCFETFKLECYIGVPVMVNGAIYGTLNFSSARPYGHRFDDSDLEFMRLMGRWVGVIIAELQSMNNLKALATTDFLTGSKNRGFFTEAADQEIKWSRRHGHPLSMALIDLDHFKNVNDRFGHQAGDEALKGVARVCQQALRTSDLFARLGGEEFAILLRHTTEDEAREVCERLRAAVAEQTLATTGGRLRITISTGVAELAVDEDFKALYNRVDAALYEAKHQGRNRVIVSGAG